MKREIAVVDEARGIRQLTTCDERWYTQDIKDPFTGEFLRTEIRPSVTFIADAYPKGAQYERWLKKHGMDADAIRDLKAEEGFLTHRAVAKLNMGQSVGISEEFVDQDGHVRQLTPDEYLGSMSYVQWWEEEGSKRFTILEAETVAWPDPEELAARLHRSAKYFFYGGMTDIVLLENKTGYKWIVDCKISPAIYVSHELQVEMYRLAKNAKKAAILQLNYRYNKHKKYKFTEVHTPLSLLCANWEIWHHETEGIQPLQREYPLELRLSGVNQ